jgi:hypothetical protein
MTDDEPIRSGQWRLTAYVQELQQRAGEPNMAAEFGEIRRSWITDDNDRDMGCHQSIRGTVPVAALLEHLATVAWTAPATDEERRRRAERQRSHDERHAAWERETYERLRAKFEEPLTWSVWTNGEKVASGLTEIASGLTEEAAKAMVDEHNAGDDHDDEYYAEDEDGGNTYQG